MTHHPASFHVITLEREGAEARLSELADILVDAVNGGASVSFMQPFTHTEAIAYWQTIILAVAARKTILLAATQGDRAVGTVQLQLSTPPNQQHRADVAKLLVHRSARKQGIGRALMQQVEVIATHQGRRLLTLDTMTGTAAEQLYLSLGYVKAGIIPDYAHFPDGEIGSTSLFYKLLT
jgi:ribosomal protein S18 acetylase RimI-like enzyme